MHGYCLILRRRATHSDCRAAHCYHITTSPRCRASNGTSSPSYHITKSLTTQPTKHTTKSPTSHLPPQTHNTHPKTSLTLKPKFNKLPHSLQHLITLISHHKNRSPPNPQNLLIPNSIKTAPHPPHKQTDTTLQTNRLQTHHSITYLTPTTPNSQHTPKHLPSLSQHNSINKNTFGNISPSHIA